MVDKKSNRSSNIAKEAFAHIFKKSATHKYPFVGITVPEGFRGKQVFDINKCISCSLCARDCPANAIEMVEVEGKKRPMFYLDRCVFCYQCADSCTKNAISPTAIFELACLDRQTLKLKPEPAPKASA